MMAYQKKWLMLSSLCVAVPSLAASTDNFKFAVNASTDYTDNAQKNDAEKISERQDRYAFLAGGRYNNDWLFLVTDYDASQQHYDRESEPATARLEGKSSVQVGAATQPFGLLITHDRHSLLNAPELVDVERNRDDREIITVSPSAKWRITSADVLILSGNFSDVSYKHFEQGNSTRKGEQLVWTHAIDRVDELQLSAQAYQSEFDQNPSAGYDYQNFNARYAVTLNHLSYGVQAGVNRAVPEQGAVYSHPSYNLNLAYTTGSHVFSFFATQTITDSSMGDGNRAGLGGGSSLSSGLTTQGSQVDLINERSAELLWTNSGLCERCAMSVNVTKNSEDYKNLPFDAKGTGVASSFHYRVTREISMGVDVSRVKREFTESHSVLSHQRFSIDYQWFKDLAIKTYVQHEANTSLGLDRNYQEHRVGLQVNYQF